MEYSPVYLIKVYQLFVASYVNENENYSKTSLELMAQNAHAVQNVWVVQPPIP